MTTRLNKQSRARIERAIIHHRFGLTVKAFYNDRADIAYAVMNDVIDGDDRAVMNALDEGWLPKFDHLTVQFGASHDHCYFGGNYFRWSEPAVLTPFEKPVNVLLPLPYKIGTGVVKVYNAREKIAQQHERMLNTLADLTFQINEATKATHLAIAGHKSIEDLVTAWPEIAPFCEPEKNLTADRSPRSLPVVQRDVLNKMLDLPIEGDDDDV